MVKHAATAARDLSKTDTFLRTSQTVPSCQQPRGLKPISIVDQFVSHICDEPLGARMNSAVHVPLLVRLILTDNVC